MLHISGIVISIYSLEAKIFKIITPEIFWSKRNINLYLNWIHFSCLHGCNVRNKKSGSSKNQLFTPWSLLRMGYCRQSTRRMTYICMHVQKVFWFQMIFLSFWDYQTSRSWWFFNFLKKWFFRPATPLFDNFSNIKGLTWSTLQVRWFMLA